jgi:DNA adenine methylase
MICRYPGGKNKISNSIIDRIIFFYASNGSDYTYLEPFFGAGGLGIRLLERTNRVKNIWINDYDIGMASIWTSVINEPELLIEKLKEITPSTDTFFKFKEELLSCGRDITPNADMAVKKIAVHQMSYSGLGTKSGGPLGGKNQESAYDVSCRWSIPHLSTQIRKYHAIFKERKITGNCCHALDFEKLLKKTPEKSFVYLDPPYYEKGPILYQECFSDRDHFRLARTLQKAKYPWLLSYDDCVDVKKMYDWADFLEIEINYTINTSRIKKELLIAPKEHAYLLKDPNKRVDLFE